MKKLNALVLAIAFAVLALVAASLSITPAQAGTGGQPDHCKEVGWSHSAGDDDWHMYLKVCWNDNPAGGINLTDVQERVDNGYWETIALNCEHVRVWNDKGILKWGDNGSSCDIPKNYGYRVYDNLSVKMPDAGHATAVLTGVAQLDGAADANVRISFNFG